MEGKANSIVTKRARNQKRLKEKAPLLFKGFEDLMSACYAKSALDVKCKELIAIALSVSR